MKRVFLFAVAVVVGFCALLSVSDARAFVPAAVVQQQQQRSISLGSDPSWQKCADLPLIGETCVAVIADPAALSVNITLSIRGNVVINEEIAANHLCVDDMTLLKLAELIPVLAPYKALLEEIIKIHGFIPADIFSLCLELQDLNINYQQKEATGDVWLDATILCLGSKCLGNFTHDFGAFDIHY
eukprot:ANDGO_06997.mRNA.1 hypothetical protein CAOG_07776